MTGDSGRAAARAALDAALSGVELTATDRRFLARLSQWDKRNATTVASLVTRARQRGRREAALSLECGLCAEHARDADRARVFAELAAALGGGHGRPDFTRAGTVVLR